MRITFVKRQAVYSNENGKIVDLVCLRDNIENGNC